MTALAQLSCPIVMTTADPPPPAGPETPPFRRPFIKRVGKRIKAFLHASLRLLFSLRFVVPAGDGTPDPALPGVQTILVVRPNMRLGNVLLSTPIVAALRARFPDARIDYLGGAAAAVVLKGLPVDTVMAVPRAQFARPLRLIALGLRLRRQRYDLVVDAGHGSVSSMVCTWLSGARYRAGTAAWAGTLYNLRGSLAGIRHACDEPAALCAALRIDCPAQPVFRVLDAERDAAIALLAAHGLAAAGMSRPFVALVPGGHVDKRWPTPEWLDLGRRLAGEGIPCAVLIGPDELHLQEVLREALGPAAVIIPPRPLREFAALLGEARLVVAPDTGPMHLAVAVGTPVVAVVQTSWSSFYTPRGEADRVLFRPAAAAVMEAILGHPRCPAGSGAGRLSA